MYENNLIYGASTFIFLFVFKHYIFCLTFQNFIWKVSCFYDHVRTWKICFVLLQLWLKSILSCPDMGLLIWAMSGHDKMYLCFISDTIHVIYKQNVKGKKGINKWSKCNVINSSSFICIWLFLPNVPTYET